MKNLITILIFLLLFSFSFMKNFVFEDGLIMFEGKPYTGYVDRMVFESLIPLETDSLYNEFQNYNFHLTNMGNVVNGKKDGIWKKYYKNGQIHKEITYKNGELDGRWIWYYDDGSLEEEGYYIDGKEEGVWVIVDSLGYINKGNYKNGKREDIWDWYYVSSKTLDTIKVGEQFLISGGLKNQENFFFFLSCDF